MVLRRRMFAALLAVVALFVVAACGGDDSGGSGGGGSSAAGSASTGVTDGAKAAPTSADSKAATGSITYCQGKDTNGAPTAAIKALNAENNGLKVKLLEFPASADEQRNQFVQRQQAKSGECDVFSSDVIWTAEFAAQKWLLDMSKYIDARKSVFVPSTLETVNYDGKFWGVPDTSDAAFIYYRSDKVKSIPDTWQGVYAAAKTQGGIVYQGAAYEGLTCDFLELAFAAGGKVLNDDGTKSAFNSPETIKALQFMVDGVKDGTAPKAVTTYMEEESRRSFESGGPVFMRNWPYAYALGEAKGSKVAGKLKVAPFPTFEGGGKAGILGGHNFVVSAYSKNPKAAVRFIDYMTSPEQSIKNTTTASLTPTQTATYADASVKKALPFSDQLLQAIKQAKARPVSPVYPQISQAIYKNVNAALSGQVSPADAVKTASTQIDAALATF